MRHTTAPHTEDRAAAGLRATPPPALRLLVTNPWNGQAYCVLRALRPYAARVIATAYREHGLLGRLAPGAVSRFVDGVYQVPFAAQDWQRGRIRDENSESEEAYVQAILDICAREDIDTVFPSWDPEVGILSRNKSRFAARGITVPVPEWPVLRQGMDKHALAELAAEIGCLCPRTYLPRTVADAAELAEQVGFPLLLKPRCSSGSRGVRLVMRRDQLADTIESVERTFGMPILQEWIPGRLDRRINVNATMDRQGRLITATVRRNARTAFPSFASVTTTQVSRGPRAGRAGRPSARPPRVHRARQRPVQGGSAGRRRQAPRAQLPAGLPGLVQHRVGPEHPVALRPDRAGVSWSTRCRLLLDSRCS